MEYTKNFAPRFLLTKMSVGGCIIELSTKGEVMEDWKQALAEISDKLRKEHFEKLNPKEKN